MIGPLVLRLMLAWQRHVDRRELARWAKDTRYG